MEVQGLYEKSNATGVQTGVAGGNLGKDEFMKMLVAQMQNQDPMAPVDNAQMTAQLAQFSALEQMENLNGQFEGFRQGASAAMSLMNAGKPVMLELVDGSVVKGVLEKVQWVGGETQYVVDGTAYANADVKSLQANEEAAVPVSGEETA